jgi:hypothetical protein
VALEGRDRVVAASRDRVVREPEGREAEALDERLRFTDGLLLLLERLLRGEDVVAESRLRDRSFPR